MTDFNPSEHNVDEVVAYLEQADTDEQTRVLEAEADDKDRATIRDWTAPAPDAPTAPAPEPEADPKPEDDDGEEFDFAQTEDNAILLLAAVEELGLNPSVVTTKDGRLQAPAAVVKAAGITNSTDKD